jgi:spermidine synthase
MATAPDRAAPEALNARLLLLTALVIAICGLIYELLAGTLASYLLGDSITQFSIVIGVYLSAMGAGSWLSGQLDREIARRFVEVELAVAVVGGFAAPILFLSFAHLAFFKVVLYGLVATVGTLVGLEIPLLLRVLKDQFAFKDLIARVLTVDYVGALVASLLFPIFLVPRLGMVRTGLTFGLLNAGVGLWSTYLLAAVIPRPRDLRVKAAVILALLLAGVVGSERLTTLAEEGMYADEIIFSKSTPYQRIVITRGRASFQLFLNGNLQFSSADEHRYHEALVHPAMALAQRPRRVLVLGGGDGLAARCKSL